jgi:hypothetical protein
MQLIPLGEHPVLHSARSSVDSALVAAPHLEESRNDLQISAPVFRKLHKKLGELAIDVSELNGFLAGKKTEHVKFITRKLDEVEDGDVEARKNCLQKYGARSFRVLVRYDEKVGTSSSHARYNLMRYVVRYDEKRVATHGLKKRDGTVLNYVMRIQYVLVHKFATTRTKEDRYSIECSSNATQLEGEAGTAFATSMWKLTKDQWETKMLDVYCRPYRILCMVAGCSQAELMKSGPTQKVFEPAERFDLGIDESEMRHLIHVQTFGFRWMMLFKPSDPNAEEKSNVRELMLLMLYTLYNSKHKFLTRDVGVAQHMKIDVDVSRKTDRQEDVFGYATSHVEEDNSATTPVEERIKAAFDKQDADPLTCLRVNVKSANRNNRHPLYTMSFTIPSERYLRQCYRATDGLEVPGSERLKIKNVWRDMAKYGLMLGVDAYSGYLRNGRNITTLDDLLRLFINEYDRDIQNFCQQILDTTYEKIDIIYWTGCGWMEVMRSYSMKETLAVADRPTWDWLSNKHPDMTITEFMVSKGDLGTVSRENGRVIPTKEQVAKVKLQVDYWKATYGYDPSYSYGAHSEVVRSWTSPDNPQTFYRLEREGATVDRRIILAQKVMTKGLGSMLPKMLALPIKPPAKPSKLAA